MAAFNSQVALPGPPWPYRTGLSGKISWFGGPNDKTTGSTTASGMPITDPGIAVNNQATLGGWWAVKTPNGNIGIIRQTDIGPASWTGRTFDFTYSALPLFGYTQGNFPTGSQITGYYLGKSLTDIGLHAAAAVAALKPTAVQDAALQQAIDVGAVFRGHSEVVSPKGKTGTAPGVATQSGSEAQGSSGTPLSGLSDIAAALGKIFGFLTDPTNWLRIGEVIAGLILLAMGLRSMTGSSLPTIVSSPVRATKAALS